MEAAAFLAYRRGDAPGMAPFCDDGLALARALHDRVGEGIMMNQLALIAVADGDPARAGELFEESANLLAGHPYARYPLGNVGSNSLQRGDTARAITILTSALELDRTAEDDHHRVGVTAWLSVAASREGDDRAAFDFARESLSIAAHLVGAEEATALALLVAAHALRRIDPGQATRAFASAKAILERVGARHRVIVPGLDDQQLRTTLENALGSEFAHVAARGALAPVDEVVASARSSLG